MSNLNRTETYCGLICNGQKPLPPGQLGPWQIGTEVNSNNIGELHPLVGWLVVLRINVDLAIFQPNLVLEAGDNQSLKIQVARPGIEPRHSCSASQELNHSATAAPTPVHKDI